MNWLAHTFVAALLIGILASAVWVFMIAAYPKKQDRHYDQN